MCTYFFLSRPQFLKGLTCCSTQSFRLCCWKATSQIEHYHCLRSNSQVNKRQCQLIDLSQRYFSNKVPKNETKKELDIKRESPYAGLSAAEKVKEAGKDASYIAIIIAGIGVIGVVFYTVGKELFSSQSPAGVYSKALKKCQNNIEVLDTLGEPITGHGTSGSRRRKQHVSSQEFMENGVKHMRVVFKIEGPYRKGTVHVEVFQDDSKKYQFKHVICELQGYPSRTIVIENNR